MGTSHPIDADVLVWLQQHAAELKGLDGPGDNFGPFYRVVNDARIVLLAQPTFGAHEPLLLQHQLFQHMVMELGFRSLALEAPSGAVNLLNGYLQTGDGVPEQILNDSDFLNWNNQELLYLVKWMRAYNVRADPASKLSIYGIDFQTVRLAFNFMQLSSFMRKVDAARLDFVNSHLRCFAPYLDTPSAYAQLPAIVTTECHDQIQQLYDDLTSRQAQYEARSSASEFATILHTARVTLQAEDYAANFGGPSEFALREQYLAENIRWIAEQGGPDMKLMVWAHMTDADFSAAAAPQRMSRLLRSQYGNALRLIGLSFYDGSFYAPLHSGDWPYVQHVTSAPKGSVEEFFHRVGLSRAVIDLRGIQPDSPIGRWFSTGYLLRGVGTEYDEAQPSTYFSRADLPGAFDALLFLDRVGPSDLRSQGVITRAPPDLAGPTNLDFKEGMTGWSGPTIDPSGYESGLDYAVTHSGIASAYLKASSDNVSDRTSLSQQIFGELYRGKRIRLSGYLRSENVALAAGLSLGDDSMEGNPIAGTTDWTRYELVVDVPQDVTPTWLGLWLQGQGQVWVDDLRLEIVGKDVPLTYMHGAATMIRNGGFEEGLRPWLPANQRNFLFVLDPVVQHSGAASLKIQARSAAPNGSALLSQVFDPQAYVGKRIRLSGYIKASEVQSSAILWIGIQGTNYSLDSYLRYGQPVKETTGWVKSEIVVDVPPESNFAIIGVNLEGPGTIWLDDVQLENIAMATPTTSRLPLATTPIPTPGSAPRQHDWAGQGSISGGGIDVAEGLAVFRMESDGTGPFSVSLGRYGEPAVEHIVDTSSPFSGATAARIPATGRYLLNVQATGAWRIRLEQPLMNDDGVRFGYLPQTFTGQGKQVSPPFYLNFGQAKFHLVYDGFGRFKVNLVDKDGMNELTVADFDGSLSGHMDDVFGSGPPSGAGNHLLDISAGGAYTITVAQ